MATLNNVQAMTATHTIILETKLQQILDQYRTATTIHPVVAQAFDTPELQGMLYDSLALDVTVIAHRSQDIRDGEITLYQKALTILVDEEGNQYGAVNLYIEEVLGVHTLGDVNIARALLSAVTTRELALNGTSLTSDEDLHAETALIQSSSCQATIPTRPRHLSRAHTRQPQATHTYIIAMRFPPTSFVPPRNKIITEMTLSSTKTPRGHPRNLCTSKRQDRMPDWIV